MFTILVQAACLNLYSHRAEQWAGGNGQDGINVFCVDVPVGLAMLSGGAAVHDVLSLRLNVTAVVAGLALEQGNRVSFTLAAVVFTVNVLTSAIQTLYAESLEGDMRPFSRSVVLPYFNNHVKGISYHSTCKSLLSVSDV
ncbi:hypothetical protein ERJ75_001218300 [Trypanosoma vivax]|nr:hypothetical protein ERJ75_001218300 [Trypanosoma vivax]